VPKQIPHLRVHHNDEFVDNYEWLRNKDSAEVIGHLEAENRYTEQQLEGLKPISELIFNQIKSRTKETDMSVANRHGNYWYFARTVAGLNYPLSYRLAVDDLTNWIPPQTDDETIISRAELIFDPNSEVKQLNAEFYTLGSSDVSDDGNLMLYAYDISGDERYQLHIRDLRTGQELADVLDGTAAGATFDVSGRYIFYTRTDSAWRSWQLWRHVVGEASCENDVLIYQEEDAHFSVSCGISLDKQYIILQTSSKTTDEIWLLNADNPTGQFEVFRPRQTGVEYDVEFVGNSNYYFVTHNQDSPDFDIDLYGDNHELVGRWLSSGNGRTINGLTAYRDFIVVSMRENVLRRLYILQMKDFVADPLHPELHWQELKPEGLELYSISAGASEYESPVLKYTYTSYTTPAVLVQRDMRTGQDVELKRQVVLELPDQFQASNLNREVAEFQTEQLHEQRLWAIGDDGQEVPISLVYKGQISGAHRPCLLSGYGSYGISEDPYFSIPRLSLLDFGFVVAVAHVRGGQELGRNWYDSGKLNHKMNTFTDFVAVARHLIDQGITVPDKLVINGGSAGGLLVGAALNLAPELFAGVQANVPFVDPLTSILMPELPLTIPEWEEWGNPLEDQLVYHYIKQYSPYENIRRTANPPQILATTSLNDTRVLYVEPAKWVAKLRELGYPALLKCEMSAGHGGVSGRYNSWKEIAFELAWVVGVTSQG
jgi:oligopeptidase B